MLLTVLSLVVLPVVLLLGASKVAARRRRREEEEHLRATPPDELARQVRAVVEMEGWQRLPAGAAILVRDADWTDELLKERLDALWLECTKEDAALGQVGSRMGNEFELYDTGISVILGELDRRTRVTRTAYRG
jgi:hypothetical protein